MSSWKQKLKEFSSSSRGKSPTPNEPSNESILSSSSSIQSGILGQKLSATTGEVLTGSESRSKDQVLSAKVPSNPDSHKDNSDIDRRSTITPDMKSLSIADETLEAGIIGKSDLDIYSKPNNQRNFNLGLLTVKIYQGSNFVIPFNINRDTGLVSKLQSTVNDHQLKGQLCDSLADFPLDSDNTVSLVEKDQLGSLIPANVRIPSTEIRNSLIYFTLEFDNTNVVLEAESGTISHPIFNKVSQFDVTRPHGELKFQMFLRLPRILTEIGDESKSTHEILISSAMVKIDLSHIHNPVRIYGHEAVDFQNEFKGFWKESNGELVISVDFKPYHNKQLCVEDFDLLKVIGKGSFGKVMQVRKKDSGKIYALKAIRKSHIVSRSEVVHTLAERTVLARVDNPFIVPLKFSFQSPEKLYLVLSFINGGELFYHLQKEGKFELQRSRLYTAELLSALECLHSLDVIYRDLKPENILLDYKGHIALCDFGLCKLDMKNTDKTKTFCGTPEYLAPELLLGNGYTKSVDWWTLGVLLYEMLTGLPPYYDTDVSTMYQKILKDPLKFPNDMDSDAKDILIHLLARDPRIRLGTNGSSEIKSHPFFKAIDWRRLNAKGYQPPFKPYVRDGFDTSNFDQEFTNELPVDSVINEFLSESVQKQFGGWTYVGTENLGGTIQP